MTATRQLVTVDRRTLQAAADAIAALLALPIDSHGAGRLVAADPGAVDTVNNATATLAALRHLLRTTHGA